MAVDFTTNHADANVSKLLATNYGGHIYNVTLSSAADNGNIVKRGNYNSFDNYDEASANSFNGIVRGQAANGNWYVEVLADLGFDALLVYNVPDNPYENPKTLAGEKRFYLAAGEVARAHQLYTGDICEVSREGFEGNLNNLNAGVAITAIGNKKLVIA
ncbi:MAG: hypothetical protein LIR46_03315 [Bacteroidota bacterium]|nr:hypothetical protein [Bacteroidota bacterium]